MRATFWFSSVCSAARCSSCTAFCSFSRSTLLRLAFAHWKRAHAEFCTTRRSRLDEDTEAGIVRSGTVGGDGARAASGSARRDVFSDGVRIWPDATWYSRRSKCSSSTCWEAQTQVSCARVEPKRRGPIQVLARVCSVLAGQRGGPTRPCNGGHACVRHACAPCVSHAHACAWHACGILPHLPQRFHLIES
jgi:hypothetical protein